MRSTNLLFILSDEHTRRVAGCYGGHPSVTPSIDRLAAEGVRFRNAYTNCPICVPARASLATGRYVHRADFWDNAMPYDGSVPSWGHVLKSQGHTVAAIGKLHFRSTTDDNGFTEEIEPLHVVGGIGDPHACIRDDPPRRHRRPGIEAAGPGDSTYIRYDALSTERVAAWLQAHARDTRPWVLFVGFVLPHPPYISPPEQFERFRAEPLPPAPQGNAKDWPRHPVLEGIRRCLDFDTPFSEETVRRLTAAYYGATAYMDSQVGRVLQTLESLGLSGSTRVIYTSDHGECLGARGLFGKFTMYEESVGIPLVVRGPDVPKGAVVDTPVSLVDIFPTILQITGAAVPPWAGELPGVSLLELAAREPDRDREILAEYHALGAPRGFFMLRRGAYKYVHYIGAPPQLFDLGADPDELSDLAGLPSSAGLLTEMEGRLRRLADVEAADLRAREAQRRIVERHGGRAALEAVGSFDNSPVPGEAPAYRR